MRIRVVSDDSLFNFGLDWPDGWRVPTVGEVLRVRQGNFRVEAVYWEIDYAAVNGVQLRVMEER